MKANPWPGLWMGAWFMGLEASTVITLRTLKMAAGGDAGRIEGQRMISEKIEAAIALQTLAMTGGLGTTPAQAAARVLGHYSPKVRANRKRLTGRRTR